METFFVIVDATTKQPMNYPNTSGLITEAQILQWIDDMINNGGMGSNQELIASYEPDTPPNVSDALYTYSELRQYVDEAHPTYPMLKQFRITYPLEATTSDYKKQVVINKQDEADESTMPIQKRLRNLILAFDNALKALGYDKNTTLITTKKKKEIKLIQNIADKIRANKTIKENKFAAIDNNQNPNVNSDWNVNSYDDEENNIVI